MQNNTNTTNPTEVIKVATFDKLETLVNANIVNKNLEFINNIAKSQDIKNNLVQDIFNDYLANKSQYKTLMLELGYKEENIKNKQVAKFYFESQIKLIGLRLFNDYGVEIKHNEKGYSLVNTKKSIEAQNYIKGAKEYLKNTFTLLELLSTNNLKLRIKLIDFSTLKSILTNLIEEIDGVTVKALINQLDINLNDIEYLKALKGILRSIKKEVKPLSFDVKSIKSVTDIDNLIKLLNDRKIELLNPIEKGVEEIKEDISISEVLEITE